MFNIATCFVGSLSLLVISEYLYKYKLLIAEDRRKFVHITVGTFIAFWPWLIGWRTIQAIGLLMALGVAVNRRYDIFRYSKGIHRKTYGEYYFALAVTFCALLTTNKLFFALAVLHMALADGLAAITGKHFGKKLRYKVFTQDKTLVGTMTFWFVSLCILGIGIPFAHNYIDYNHYYWLIGLLPPALALTENFAVFGLDDIAIPVVVVLVLNLART
ncbi:MAG: dolichol kinase [Candidatus Saccharibacteria bacterium]|nr:dolichol kinase [Candidatus Saccharibacteria bacterium]